MGLAKHEMMRQEDLAMEATDISVAAGVLERCEFHGFVWETGAEHADAYRLGNARFARRRLSNDFRSRRELTL